MATKDGESIVNCDDSDENSPGARRNELENQQQPYHDEEAEEDQDESEQDHDDDDEDDDDDDDEDEDDGSICSCCCAAHANQGGNNSGSGYLSDQTNQSDQELTGLGSKRGSLADRLASHRESNTSSCCGHSVKNHSLAAIAATSSSGAICGVGGSADGGQPIKDSPQYTRESRVENKATTNATREIVAGSEMSRSEINQKLLIEEQKSNRTTETTSTNQQREEKQEEAEVKKEERNPEAEQALIKRRYVLLELVETERDYVTDLGKLVEGYLEEIRRQLVDSGVDDILTTGVVMPRASEQAAAATTTTATSTMTMSSQTISTNTTTCINVTPPKAEGSGDAATMANSSASTGPTLSAAGTNSGPTSNTSATGELRVQSQSVVHRQKFVASSVAVVSSASSQNSVNTCGQAIHNATTSGIGSSGSQTNDPSNGITSQHQAEVVSSANNLKSSTSNEQQQQQTTTKSPSLPEALKDGKHKIIFGNIEAIYEFHRDHFLVELERCLDEPQRLGPLFKRYERRLNMYVVYCQNKPRSEAIVSEYLDSYFEVSFRFHY